ncbi:MAG: Flp pilus assembly protein CpaB [Alphaproteobacteria bacterium]
MRITAIIVIVVALAISGLTFYLVQNYLESQSAQTAEAKVQAVASVQVVVAARDLPAGTILQDGDARWQPWPDQSLDPNFVVQREGQGADQLDEFVGTVVRRGFTAGEPMTFIRVFKRDEAGFMSGALTPGMRALSVRINAITGASGFITPGDYVDIILTQDLRQSDQDQFGPQFQRASETVMRDVRVLAIDQSADDLEGTTLVGQTATVEVTPKQAEILSVASAMGTLSLALRSLSPGNIAASGTPFTSDLEVSAVLGGGTANDRSSSATQSSSAEVRAFNTVKVYRANNATTVRVSQ